MASIVGPRKLEDRDRDRLVQLLADEAVAHPDGVRAYFRSLIVDAEIPPTFKRERAEWPLAAYNNAVELVFWAQNKGTNPQDPNFSTLGSILDKRIADFSLEKATTIASLFVAYGLCRDPQRLDELAMRYQIPQQPVAGADYGPEIDWRGPSDIELQGWFRPEPDLLDVGFLERAIERAGSVCRVEVGLMKVTGTGVLIDSDLVLTNFHVLGDSVDALAKAAPSTKLRFGLFTTRGGDEKVGQVVLLDAAKPIVASSPAKIHDFVLLRASPAIHGLTKVGPAPFSLAQPAVRSGVNILQHPGGKGMMLAISGSGITGTYPDVGYLQYISRTAPGSSGGPCFDDDWNVIAVHHAVRSKAFGVIGEGILMSNIYPEIRDFVQTGPS
jgi:S1-C subfamily serine protease